MALLQDALQNRENGRAAGLAKRLMALRRDDRRFERIWRDLNAEKALFLTDQLQTALCATR